MYNTESRAYWKGVINLEEVLNLKFLTSNTRLVILINFLKYFLSLKYFKTMPWDVRMYYVLLKQRFWLHILATLKTLNTLIAVCLQFYQLLSLLILVCNQFRFNFFTVHVIAVHKWEIFPKFKILNSSKFIDCSNVNFVVYTNIIIAN